MSSRTECGETMPNKPDVICGQPQDHQPPHVAVAEGARWRWNTPDPEDD